MRYKPVHDKIELMNKFDLVIFCKTFKRDIDCFIIQALSIKKHNIENIPYYISVPTEDIDIFEELKEKYKLTYSILADEEISQLVKENEYDNKAFNVNYINQQLVKFEFSKTNIAKHYIVLDGDCYFIKNFVASDFLLDSDTPYMPLTEGNKGDRLLFQLYNNNDYCSWNHKIKNNEKEPATSQEFIGREGKYYTLEMPYIITSSYIMDFENNFLKNKKHMTLKETLIKYPCEMQLYVDYVLYKKFKYQACNAFFLPNHHETMYQISRWLGFDEDIIANNYLGILMNKGYVKSLKFKPNFVGKYIIRNIIKLHNKISKQRVPITIKLLLGIIPNKNLRIKIREMYR